MGCVKDLAELNDLTSIPTKYTYFNTFDQEDGIDAVAAEEKIPIIDFPLLNSAIPDQRAKVIQDLGKACQDWGFFMLVNHGVPESLMERMLAICQEFFNQPEDVKLQSAEEHVLAPLRYGTSFNPSVDKVFFWRDFLRIWMHPQFYSPPTPAGFSEIAMEYSQRTRQVARELLRGISQSLGLEECYIDKAMEMDSCFQILVANLYPPCPQPELAMGFPPHSDTGLLTLLIQNQNGGLQVNHNGKWVNVHVSSPNTILVNVADHLERLSNGKYKSVLHRAIVNNKTTRISLAETHGPCPDKIVTPVAELVENETYPAVYPGMTYKEEMYSRLSNQIAGKSHLEPLHEST
ncbi:Dmr6-like oxygenase [Thalictrum thalictroides]|uniref:Dmr6-like oxygenase n=1 Tax=Thalictrum thalictroides TaxID=46969 RepID=A0A7J6V4Z6_THATH|nr:Dmr6-like oxygenase [Thalictrum thalictroides]